MDINALYNEWLEKADADPDLKVELENIKGNDDEILDRFYRSLEFGTAGLRGVIGAGTNRMNVYTVGRATQGLADYLNDEVFAGQEGVTEEPVASDVAGFDEFLKLYNAGLPIERAAVETMKLN